VDRVQRLPERDGAGAPAPPALAASRALGLLDEARVPYIVTAGAAPGGPWHALSAGRGAGLHWYAGQAGEAAVARRLGQLPLVGRIASPEAVAAHARRLGGDWAPVPGWELAAPDAPPVPVLRDGAGGTILPFDPDEVVLGLRAERYRGWGRRRRSQLQALARSAYYAARPLVPRAVQIRLRRSLTGVQGRATFPRWPAETGLHDLTAALLAWIAGAAEAPLPAIAPWPAGRSWALVLTHDVETAAGRDAIGRLRSVEEPLGMRSSFNFVPERYAVPDALVASLTAAGCEVGVHGLRHDGRDLASLRTLRRRLPEIRRWAERWQAVGFRSPATHRRWEWMPMLGFDYDTSSPDTDPFEPIPGGCCSWLPFFNDGMVELPITMPQDHTVFVILGRGGEMWDEKAALLRDRGGMALMIVHPDYMLEDGPLGAYERFLTSHAGDPTVWNALPREVSDWWRRRSRTSLVPDSDGWRAEGPAAAEASVVMLTPVGPE
jgi:hypothetical protein